jgi:integrase
VTLLPSPFESVEQIGVEYLRGHAYPPSLQKSVISEALGLVWEDIDRNRSLISVRFQLSRSGKRVELKTGRGLRDVVLMDALAKQLREPASPRRSAMTSISCRRFSNFSTKAQSWRPGQVRMRRLRLARARTGCSRACAIG